MYYIENNMLNTTKVMALLHAIYSDNMAEQCTEAEYPEKINELQQLRASVISLPFHVSIPDEIMSWVQVYFNDHYIVENFYDFRHYTQRCFIHVLDETIQTLEYDLNVENKINAIDISDMLGKIFKD